MASTVTARARANQRAHRVSHEIDRSSGYILGSMSTFSTTKTTSKRDSSLGIPYRTHSREPPLVNRSSFVVMPDTETAKYNREAAIKEIHSNFMKAYKETNYKLSGKLGDDDDRRSSKAYQKIVNNAQPSFLNEKEAQKQCISEMFMETNKFSTKTLAAINGLDGAIIRKKQEYNWRKEMEEYEKRAEFERDVRARNVSAMSRSKPADENDGAQVNARKRQPSAGAKSARSDDGATVEKAAKADEGGILKKWRAKREARKAAGAAASELDAQSAVSARLAEAEKKKLEVGGSKDEEEAEDVNGTKKLRGDFDFMMSSLSAEMEEGRSKLAKLRERIRKAKGAIVEADKALADNKS